MNYQLIQGDCLEVLPTLEAQSIDAIITDLPYGTTACKWDEVIPFAPMWEQVKRVLKPRGAFVTTASQPFTSALVMSNPEWFRYCWVWEKNKPTGFFHAKNKPLRSHEDIAVFYRQSGAYAPQGLVDIKPVNNGRRNKRGSVHDGGIPNPVYFQTVGNYPRSVISFDVESKTDHSAQKPIALYEYLIRTYTNEGDTVLDFTMGSGTTGVACVQTGRNFIGIELDEGYYNVAKRRIEQAAMQMHLLEVTA
jgi:site-specific DNA-methyltransferase (adenine-specific)